MLCPATLPFSTSIKKSVGFPELPTFHPAATTGLSTSNKLVRPKRANANTAITVRINLLERIYNYLSFLGFFGFLGFLGFFNPGN
jgi:hypothetical protein